jgi:NAD(P)H-flavin reductase
MGDGKPNPYRPYLGTLVGRKELATEITLFQIRLNDPAEREAFVYRPGQFACLSAFGVGEAPFGITSVMGHGESIDFAISRVGTVTSALHALRPGDMVGVRGPLGNGFPLEDLRGKDVVFLGGGIGGAPLRPVITTMLDRRDEYGKLTILWAARLPSLLIFTEEYEAWQRAPKTELHLTVDQAEAGWTDNVGLITRLLAQVAPSPEKGVAIVCGPPIMIHFTILELKTLGFTADQIIVTLEAKMKCGIGKCGRCNIGEKYVCLHGPVFTYAEIAGVLESFL